MPRATESGRQIDRVLAALNAGCETAAEVALREGMPVNTACHYLSQLESVGAAECTGVLMHNGVGPKPRIYKAKRFRVILVPPRKRGASA